MKKTLIALMMMGLSTGAMAEWEGSWDNKIEYDDFGGWTSGMQEPNPDGIKKVSLSCIRDDKDFNKKLSNYPIEEGRYFHSMNPFTFRQANEFLSDGYSEYRFEIEFGNTSNFRKIKHLNLYGEKIGYYWEDESDNELEIIWPHRNIDWNGGENKKNIVHLMKLDRATLEMSVRMFGIMFTKNYKPIGIYDNIESGWLKSGEVYDITGDKEKKIKNVEVKLDCKVVEEQENQI